MTWTAEKIRTELRVNRKPMVILVDREWRNLTPHRAAMLDGDLVVEETAHEMRVWHNDKRRKLDEPN